MEALFNPAEISISRSVNWEAPGGWSWTKGPLKRTGDLEFVAAVPATLSVSLFFDTYEKRGDPSGLDRLVAAVNTGNPFASSDATDVTRLTRKVAKLTEVDKELHHPPICTLSWGKFDDIFTGVLTQLDQQFTMFMPNGMPVRATVGCTFTEYRTKAVKRAGELHSADVVKSHTVRRGDTLASIAATEYGDPALWRHIATANGILNPRLLQPGTVLTLPKLAG